jgi:hypothetical protein
MQVIRKTHFSQARYIVGDVVGVQGTRVQVKWQHSTSTLLPSSLIELDEEKLADLRERVKQRKAKERVEWLKERLYVCVNVNMVARVAHEGHRGPELLMQGQVKNGLCIYCGAPVVARCQRCENPVAENSSYCEQCQKDLDAAREEK